MRFGKPLAALGLWAILGCGQGASDPSDPSRIVVATVGDRSLTRGQLDQHLERTLGGPQEVAQAEPEVKSHLLDQLLEEELIVAAAASRGITVSDEETELFLENDQEADREQVRRLLLQEKVKGDVILSGVSVSEVEIRHYMEANLEKYRVPPRVVLQMMVLDDVEDAKRLREMLDVEPDRFEELAQANSLSPDPGEAQAYEEEILPESIRNAVFKLEEGEIAPVVEDPQGVFIVKLLERLEEREPDPEELYDRIRRHLIQEKNQKRYTDFVRGLRDQTPIVVNTEALDFPYSRSEGSEES